MTPEDFFARYGGLIDRDAANGCWLWRGAVNAAGYGRIDAYERGDGTRTRYFAHRLAAGTPAGMVTRHLCHTPLCVNPAHLAQGTQADNADDMVRAGRSTARLAPEIVEAVRICSSSGSSTQFLARFCGVSESAIRRATRGATMRSIAGPTAGAARNRGASHRVAKLSDSDIRAIRARRAAGEQGVSLAASYGVTPQAISLIVNRKAWRHIA